MTTGSAKAAAYDAQVSTKDELIQLNRAIQDRIAELDDLVARLTTKRDKIQQHLADAEQALADALAQRKGEK